MASRQDLLGWEQSGWPAPDFGIDANREDLERHERLHDEGRAFTYTVVDPTGDRCLGCVYLFPVEAKFLAASEITPIGDRRWEDVGAVVYHWVRTSAEVTGLDLEFLDRLIRWLRDDWPVEQPVFVASEAFPAQADLLRDSELGPRFRIVEPDKPAPYIAYG